MKRQWVSFALACLSFSLVACSLEIPNVPIFADKGKYGAVRAYTRGEAEVSQVPKLEWDKLRVGMFCMDAHALGDYRTFIQKACQNNDNCVDGIRRVVDALDREVKTEKPKGKSK